MRPRISFLRSLETSVPAVPALLLFLRFDVERERVLLTVRLLSGGDAPAGYSAKGITKIRDCRAKRKNTAILLAFSPDFRVALELER